MKEANKLRESIENLRQKKNNTKTCERPFNSTKTNYNKRKSTKRKSSKSCQLSLRKKGQVYPNRCKWGRSNLRNWVRKRLGNRSSKLGRDQENRNFKRKLKKISWKSLKL
jgi:hypothetical protein